MNINCITGGNDYLYKHMQQSLHRAKSIDIIVSFLMESGVKLLREDLEELNGVPIRILTGNYLNITQPSALYLLKDLTGKDLDLRFYKGRSQIEVADEIGISQAQVSRIEKNALKNMRKYI